MVSGPLDILPALARRVLTLPPHDTPAPLDHDAQAVANRSAEAPPSGRPGRWAGGVLARRWQIVALAAVLLLAAFLNLYRLDREGNANPYYTATVFSMTQNWHAFFFASFDSAGYVTVDKPPVGLWVQAASAKLFGFAGLSLLLPQAIAGVASVGLVFWLVRRAYGTAAGLLAGLALAVTPIAVVTNRNNTIDGRVPAVSSQDATVDLLAWVRTSCTVVTPDLWGADSADQGRRDGQDQRGQQLYDCGALAGRLTPVST